MENNQFEIQDITTISDEITKNDNVNQGNGSMSTPCAAHNEEEK